MKHINEYLLSKSKIKNKTSDDFIQFETKKEVCDFFDSKGFEKIESNDYVEYVDMISEFTNSDKPIYCIGEFNNNSGSWVRFGNGGKDNYIFFWNIKGTMPFNYEISDSNEHNIIKRFKTFTEFKDYVINYFEW